MSEVTVIDDYELTMPPLATGNATQVFEVKQKSSGQQFAMKLLLPEAFADLEQKKSLKHEATVGKSFDHPSLIRIFDLVMSKTQGYFIMEYFRSVNLKQMLRGERSVAQGRIKKIIESLSQALAHMHEKGWLHKDIKPDNILLTKGGEVKLIDFSLAGKPSGGLTKLMGGSKSIVIQGTRTYISPEMIRRKPITFSADIYSLGITFYEVLTGRPPFIHGNPNELLMAHVRDTPERPSGYNPNVTPEADALVMRMLAKDPKGRPATMQDVYTEIRSLKIFKEDPEEYAREQAKQAEDKFQDSMASRLDSRTDAGRDKSAPAPAPKPKPAPPPKPAAAKPAAPAPAASAPQPAMPPGYPPPGYPQQYPPGYGQPMPYYPQGVPVPQGQPQWPAYPQQMPPGYGYPPGYPMPPGAVPPGMMPGQPVPPPTAMPAPQAGPAAQPPAAGPVAAPAQPAARPAEKDEEEDLPLMTELPEIL